MFFREWKLLLILYFSAVCFRSIFSVRRSIGNVRFRRIADLKVARLLFKEGTTEDYMSLLSDKKWPRERFTRAPDGSIVMRCWTACSQTLHGNQRIKGLLPWTEHGLRLDVDLWQLWAFNIIRCVCSESDLFY